MRQCYCTVFILSVVVVTPPSQKQLIIACVDTQQFAICCIQRRTLTFAEDGEE